MIELLRMRNNLFVLLLIILSSVIVFRNCFNTFFAQDDFILIYEFSQGTLLEDISNSFGPPKVTHWRPIHNLFFLISGNLFEKNFMFYHGFSLLLHSLAAFFIFLLIKQISKNNVTATSACLIYAAHPAHFVTLFWISGSATTIGFLLLAISFYSFINKKNGLALFVFLLSLMASEAMVFGVALFFAYELLFKKKQNTGKKFLILLLLQSLIFLFIRFFFLTPKQTFESYSIDISLKTFVAIKYYVLRVLGFADVSSDLIISTILIGWFAVATYFFSTDMPKTNVSKKSLLLGFITCISGFFPFILLPEHLSAHYMNIAVFGFSIFISLLLTNIKSVQKVLIVSIFMILSILNINKIINNNWVVERSNLASDYLSKIEAENLANGSMIVFRDNFSTSRDAYFALGTGKAIDFWFKGKNYKYCFDAFEKCAD